MLLDKWKTGCRRWCMSFLGSDADNVGCKQLGLCCWASGNGLKVVYAVHVGSDANDVGSLEFMSWLEPHCLSFVFPGFWACPLLLGFDSCTLFSRCLTLVS